MCDVQTLTPHCGLLCEAQTHVYGMGSDPAQPDLCGQVDGPTNPFCSFFFCISELDLDQAYRLSLNPLNIIWLLV